MRQRTPVAPAEPGAAFAVDRRIRSAEEVHAAAALIPKTVDRWRGEAGPRWQITIMPGGVRLGSKDYGRLNASENARIERALREDPRVTLELAQEPRSGSRRSIVAWSAKSRANLVSALCALDYEPIAGDGTDPAMLTLTLPGSWEALAPTPQDFKAQVNRLRSRFLASWGKTLAGVWKLEFQRRGAPHLHILTSVPTGTAARPLAPAEAAHLRGCKSPATCGNTAHVRPQLDFTLWVSHAWALSVAPRGIAEFEAYAHSGEFARHLAAGTAVDRDATLRYADAKRIAAYFTKHGLFTAKEYQNELPELWLDAIKSGEMGSRFWGYWVVRPVRAIQETDPALIMHIMSDCVSETVPRLHLPKSLAVPDRRLPPPSRRASRPAGAHALGCGVREDRIASRRRPQRASSATRRAATSTSCGRVKRNCRALPSSSRNRTPSSSTLAEPIGALSTVSAERDVMLSSRVLSPAWMTMASSTSSAMRTWCSLAKHRVVMPASAAAFCGSSTRRA